MLYGSEAVHWVLVFFLSHFYPFFTFVEALLLIQEEMESFELI